MSARFFSKEWFLEWHENSNKECQSCFTASRKTGILAIVLYGLCIFAFFLFAVYVALKASLFVPTTHMDGAFQTASGLFRLQNGEVPGRDYFPYLGILPIFICFPAFILAGGHVSASVFATFFVVLLCCMFSFGVIHFFLSKKKCLLYSLCCGSALTVVFYLLQIYAPSIDSFLRVSILLSPGTSLRPIRQFAPYLCILPLYFLYKDINKARPVFLVVAAIWISLFSLWSNDYSFGTMCLALMGSCIWIMTSERNDRGKSMFFFFLVFLCGAVFFCELATLGHMHTLILYNFRDVAKDQYWYFEPLGEVSRVYSLGSFFQMFVTCADDLILPGIAALILVFDAFFTKSFSKICLLLIGCILFGGGFTASVGGHIGPYFQFFYFWGLGVVIFYVFSLTSYLKFETFRRWCCAVLFLLVTIYGFVAEMTDYQKRAKLVQNNEHWFYEASLGGYLNTYDWKSYIEFLNQNRDKSFLEEYWGIASAYLHRHTDWKVDSVIHAFNKTREECKQRIQDKDYIITSSISSDWTFWNLAQNYWFYEKVFHNYDFCFSVANSIFVWKKRETPRVFDEVNTCQLTDEHSFQIESPGMYEIRLEYDYAPRFHSLLVLLSPLGEHHDLSFPPYEDHYTFLISCTEPKVFTLHSICNPGTFKLKSVQANKVTDDIKDIYDSWKSFYLTDGSWERGYYRKSGGIFVKNTRENRTLYAVGAIVQLPDDSKRQITRVAEDGEYLNVFTDGDSFVFDIFPHQLDVVNWNAFYLTNDAWDRGYYRQSGGFFVKNTEDNRDRFAPGAYVLMPDGSKRQIIQTTIFKQFLNIFTEGGAFTTDIFPHELEVVEDWDSFYLTDESWKKGYYRESGGFFVKNTRENREKYVTGRFVPLPDGSKRLIMRTAANKLYFNVYTDGFSFVADVFPHELEAVEDWETFYVTDQTWKKGYFRSSGGFFVANTPENSDLYVVGAFVLLPDGSKRVIIQTAANKQYINISTEGEAFMADVFPHQLEIVEDWESFYLTDGTWDSGYFKQSGGFFVANTAENRERYVPGAFVLLPDGSKRQITQVTSNQQYLNIATEGDPFVADVFPHQLEVVEDWDSYYLTDERWDKGYYRRSGGFFVKNTKVNEKRYVVGSIILLPDGSKHKITQIAANEQYLNISTEGSAFVSDVFPHQLEVVEDWDTYYLTDERWDKGYYRRSGGFFVKNTKENRLLYAAGAYVQLPDGFKRLITRTAEDGESLNVFTEGIAFVTDLFPHQLEVINWEAFYLTDGIWKNGYYRKSGGFFVKNTEENRKHYVAGTFVLLPDETKRMITRTMLNNNKINVFTEGDSFVADVFPHQLEVVEDWDSFYLTDGMWDRGYFKQNGGFFVANTQENRNQYVPGSLVVLPDGSKRLITKTTANKIYLNIFTEGGPFAADVFPHQLTVVEDWDSFYLTDNNWDRGYFRSLGGFFVKNTEKNRRQYVTGAMILLPDGSKRRITRTSASKDYINIFTDGSAFAPDVFPHQLEVVPPGATHTKDK